MPSQSLSTRPNLNNLESLANDLVVAFDTGDADAVQRLNQFRRRSATWDDLRADVWHRVYKVRQAKGKPGCFTIADAQEFLAREAGYGNWMAFVDSGGTPAPGEPFTIEGDRIHPTRTLTNSDWDKLIGLVRDQRIAKLDANGHLTDSALAQIAKLEHITHLSLGSSQQVTDEGLRHLAQMPQLQHLDFSNYPGSRITDRGLEVLRHLPALQHFAICWQPAISDAGIAHLQSCDQLESVNLLGTPTGDGALQTLSGKRHLRRLRTGRMVTDAGLPFLHQIPAFASWQGGEIKYSLMSADASPNHLLLDGPFTDEGMKRLAELNGLFGLSFFWHAQAITADGLKALANLPKLGFLGCEGSLCNDEAMRHIAAIPGLRMLMAQGTVATDDGFLALSQSPQLEYLWGRECVNLSGKGFVALSRLPSLRGLAVSCKQVDDESLATLPRFPALRELMPMDVNDGGFRHVGACRNLEKLWCMYCRDTTDAATEELSELLHLKTYYAGLTQITDRSLEVLGQIDSLEEIELCECRKVTDGGLPFLARLPKLRQVSLHGSPHLTLTGTRVFPNSVSVSYSP